MPRNFFTGTEAELYTGSNHFSSLITATPTAYGLVAGQATAYAATNTAFGTAYLAAITPETRTKGKIATKNTAKTALKLAAAALAAIIEATATVTPEQKIALGLNVRKTPTPIGPPTAIPTATIVETRGRVLRIKTHDESEPDKRGLPNGVRGVSAFIATGATPPTDWRSWSLLGTSTKAIFEIEIDDGIAAGTLVWLTCYYVNPRNQAGTACAAFSTYAAGNLPVAA